ncbi:MAG: C39 family peptidase [Candidatus Rokuibacteriota bacterium]
MHLVPSFSALTPEAVSFRFELSARLGGEWLPWVAADAIGPTVFDPLPSARTALSAEIDEFTTPVPLEAIRLRLRWRGDSAALRSPWLIALSASDQQPSPLTVASMPPQGTRLRVPAISQMVVGGSSAMRICSPTSVAMVLGYWGCEVSALSVAAEAFHAATDRYGVWPAAIAAAARHDVAGYLLRFPDWPSAAWCLEQGMPVVASIRFSAGELQGAPLTETSGHLVVLTGYEGGHVLVNDPAAAGDDGVPRRYLRSEFERVWLQRGGIGYVLFRPPRARG